MNITFTFTLDARFKSHNIPSTKTEREVNNYCIVNYQTTQNAHQYKMLQSFIVYGLCRERQQTVTIMQVQVLTAKNTCNEVGTALCIDLAHS